MPVSGSCFLREHEETQRKQMVTLDDSCLGLRLGHSRVCVLSVGSRVLGKADVTSSDRIDVTSTKKKESEDF